MTIAAINHSPEGLEFLATVIEQAIEVAFLTGVLVAVGALIVWRDRWAGPPKTFISLTRAPSDQAAEIAKRRERSRWPSPAAEHRRTGDRAPSAEDAGELAGQASVNPLVTRRYDAPEDSPGISKPGGELGGTVAEDVEVASLPGRDQHQPVQERHPHRG